MSYEPEFFDSDIAIVGMAGRFPGARTTDELWRNVRGGVESIRTYTDEELLEAGVPARLLKKPNYVRSGAPIDDMEWFDAGFFGFSPKEAALLDPQHRHLLECAWEALEDACCVPAQFDGSIGLFAGSGMHAYFAQNLLTNRQLMESIGLFLVRHTGNDKDFLTTRVSYSLDLKGPSINVQTACSTSLVAVHLACQSLLGGECDMAMAGGVTIEVPHRHGYLFKENEILSPDGHCRAFDEKSEGTVFGSGVGLVVLRRLQDAIEAGDPIRAVVRASAINNDGAGKVGYLAPSVDGHAQVVEEALGVAEIEPETITYIETHGTGTKVGDPIEVAALSQAFRTGTKKKQFCGIGSIKTNIGHLDTAAGVAGLIKTVKALQARELPPSLGCTSPSPLIDFENSPFFVSSELRPWEPDGPRRAGVSALGVGGTNAHVVLEEWPEKSESRAASNGWQILPMTGKSKAAAKGYTEKLGDFLADRPDADLGDVAHTLQSARQHFQQRRAVVCRDREDAVSVLSSPDSNRYVTGSAGERTPGVVFMFPGGGAQYAGMGQGLYESEPLYREAIDECLGLLAGGILDSDESTQLRTLLFAPEPERAQATRTLERPLYALPTLFATELALARLWRSWGLEPSALIGHSMGEYTAAHLAGVFSLEDALRIVTLRGRLFETLPEGGMLSIPAAVSEIEDDLGQLSIAAINAPDLCVASGPVEAIDELEAKLAARELECRRVRIDVAAHSSMLEPILDEFERGFEGMTLRPPELGVLSNVTGNWLEPGEATDPRYWVRHLRRTVRFADGVGRLLQETDRLLVEIGPGTTLTSLARMHPDLGTGHSVVSSLRHPQEDVVDEQFFLSSVARAWTVGAEVDWSRAHDQHRRRIPLPTYAFDRQRFWIEPGVQDSSSDAVELEKLEQLDDWFQAPVLGGVRPAARRDTRASNLARLRGRYRPGRAAERESVGARRDRRDGARR